MRVLRKLIRVDKLGDIYDDKENGRVFLYPVIF